MLDSFRIEIAKDFINTIQAKGWDVRNIHHYDLLGFNRSLLYGGLKLKPNAIKANSLLKIKEKYMARQPSEFKKWWTSIAEAKLAIDELQAAIDKQVNDKDYHTKMHDSVLKLVDELGNNANFQKMITGIYTPAVFIGDNTNSHDELAKLLEEYDEKTDDLRGGNYNSKKTKRKRRNNKGITSKTNKTNKRK